MRRGFLPNRRKGRGFESTSDAGGGAPGADIRPWRTIAANSYLIIRYLQKLLCGYLAEVTRCPVQPDRAYRSRRTGQQIRLLDMTDETAAL